MIPPRSKPNNEDPNHGPPASSNQKRSNASPLSQSKALSSNVTISFENLSYSIPLTKKAQRQQQLQNEDRDGGGTAIVTAGRLTILNDLSATFVPGQLTALMGPSGSGKTTLLDLLAGRKTLGGGRGGPVMSGTIQFNHQIPTWQDYRLMVGYVEQFDTLVGELTVEDMLKYTAELKLPRQHTSKQERVEEVIQMLDLDSCRHTVIGTALRRGISGGQAKRVNIGLALITRPPVLLLDEPTSGLDSRTSNEVVSLLCNLACPASAPEVHHHKHRHHHKHHHHQKKPHNQPVGTEQRRTIVCTIHAPSGRAFSMFDELFMIQEGRTIYDGPVAKVPLYFENHLGFTRDIAESIPEWLVDLTSNHAPAESNSILQQRKQEHRGNEKEQSSMKKDDTEEEEGEENDDDDHSIEDKQLEEGVLEPTTSYNFAELFQASKFKVKIEKERKKQRQEESHKIVLATSRAKLQDERTPNQHEKHHRRDHQNRPSDFDRLPSQLSKLITLLKFRTVAHYRDGAFLGPRFGDKLIFALLIMTLYWDIGKETDPQSIASTTTLLFFLTALCGFGAAAFVPTLNLERKLYYRELADGCYSPLTYYFAKFIEESFLALFTSALFCVIVYFGCSLTGSFFLFFIAYYLTSLIGVILAYTMAATVSSLTAANALLPIYVTVCMYFGGLFIVFDKIPKGWRWFSWTSFIRYSWGALMLNNYQDSETGQIDVFFDTNGNPQTVLEFYSFEDPIMGSTGACLGMLCVLLAVFSFLGILALVFINHEKR